MGYFIINKKPIFIFDKQEQMLVDKLFKDKDGKYLSELGFRDSRSKMNGMVISYLEKMSKDDYGEFYLNWFWFDTKNIREDVRRLFEAYCYFHDHSGYVFTRDFNTHKHFSEYNYFLEFFLRYPVYPTNTWWHKLMHKKGFGSIDIVINANRINRIVGTLEKFIVYTKDFKLVCGKNIIVYPLNYSVAETIDTEEKDLYEFISKGKVNFKKYFKISTEEVN